MKRYALLAPLLALTALPERAHAQIELSRMCEGGSSTSNPSIERLISSCSGLIMDPGISESERTRAYYFRGRYEMQAKRYSAAIGDFSRTISLDSSSVGAYSERATALAALGQYELAVKDRDRVVALKPEDAWSYNNRCWARATWGQQLADALEDCDEALRLKPDSADMLDTRGLVYFRTERYQDAANDYDAALKLNAKLVSSLYMRGLTKLKLGDVSGGNADIAAAEAADRTIADTYAGYGIKP